MVVYKSMSFEINNHTDVNSEDLEAFERAMAELEEKSSIADEIGMQVREQFGDQLADVGLGLNLRPYELGGELEPEVIPVLKGIAIYVPKHAAVSWVKPDSGGSCWFNSGRISQSSVDQSNGKLSLRACVSSGGIDYERASGAIGVILSAQGGVATHYEVVFHYIASVRTAWELPISGHGNQHNSISIGAVVWDITTPGQSIWVRGVPGIDRNGYYAATQAPTYGDQQLPMPRSNYLKVPLLVNPGKRYMLVLTGSIQVSAANSKGYVESEIELVEWA